MAAAGKEIIFRWIGKQPIVPVTNENQVYNPSIPRKQFNILVNSKKIQTLI